MLSEIEKTVLRTLVYFSFFEYPLTTFETWKWQFDGDDNYSYFDIGTALDELKESSIVQEYNGFYGIKKNNLSVREQVLERHRRYRNAIIKYRKMRFIVRYLSKIPSIKGIAICNSLALHHTKEKSDIDLFIISENGQVWTTRFLSVLPVALANQRPGESSKDPIDVSFFVSNQFMDLERLKLDNDPYLTFWVRLLLPIYGSEKLWREWFDDNEWSQASIVNTIPKQSSYLLRVDYKKKINIFSKSVEKILRRIQMKKFPKEIKEIMNSSNDVVVNDNMLKFHKNDRRKAVNDYLEKKMSEFI